MGTQEKEEKEEGEYTYWLCGIQFDSLKEAQTASIEDYHSSNILVKLKGTQFIMQDLVYNKYHDYWYDSIDHYEETSGSEEDDDDD